MADLLDAVVGLIGAGLSPVAATAAVAEVLGTGSPVARALARAQALGGPAGSTGLALVARIASTTEDLSPRQRHAFGWVADVMEVAEPLGVPVREALTAVAATVRAEDADVDAAQAAAAGPRAGAAVLTAMPAACLGFGALLGADVLSTLVGTPLGRACLVLGTGAWALGRWWIRRLVTAAVQPPASARASRGRRRARWRVASASLRGGGRRGVRHRVTAGAGATAAGPGAGGSASASAAVFRSALAFGAPSATARALAPTEEGRSSSPALPGAWDPPLPSALIATLLAVGVEAGIAPQVLVPAVAEGLMRLDHPLGRPLALVGAVPAGVVPGLTAGDDAAALLAGGRVPIVDDLARALALADRAGVPPADLMRQAGAAQRRREAHARQVALSRLPVLLVLPSGLLLLPAAVALGVVPVVVDLLGRTLHG